jgi:hypothetical protein
MFGLRGRTLILLLLLFAALFAGAQYLPAYYTALQFNDYIQQEVKYAMASRKTPDNIRAEVLDKAKEFNIDVGAKDIQITTQGPAFSLELEYHIPIDLKVRQQDLVFHVNESGELYSR